MKISIGTKLMGSFLLLSLMAIATGQVGLKMVKKVAKNGDIVVEEKLPIRDVAMEAQTAADQTLNACRNFLLSTEGLQKIEEQINGYLHFFNMYISMVKYGTNSEDFKNSPGGKVYQQEGLTLKVPRGTEEMQNLIEEIEKFQQLFSEKAKELITSHKLRVQYNFDYQGTNYDLPAFLYAADVKHRRWFETLKIAVEYDVDFKEETDPTKCYFGVWYSSYVCQDNELKSLLEKFQSVHKKFHQIGADIVTANARKRKSLLSRGMRYSTKVQQGLAKLENYAEEKIKEIDTAERECVRAMFDVSEKMAEYLRQLKCVADKDMDLARTMARESKTFSIKILNCLMISAIILALLLGLFVNKAIQSIVKPIKRSITNLTDTSEKVASASGQISSASLSFAEGTSEQASSLEETSASLEEMASMTKQNAENANQADNLMKEAKQIVGEASKSMAELTLSMQEISTASEKTSKIIKTIDEIAFQTNLLALNAAVEAARAGEAGSGFAVVADEVRSLAMRAAEAAKDTATLIQSTSVKIHGGADLVSKTNTSFSGVTKSVDTVTGLMEEIAGASKDQAAGIDQVNKAVATIDNVTQKNAANAGESASASREMKAQAEQVKEIIEDLATIVGSEKIKTQSDEKIKGLPG